MKKLILVPLKRNDQAEDLLPYVEEVARPGMKAVFMVPYPVDGFRWSHEECGGKAIEEGIRLAHYYSWDTHLQKARELIAPALTTLSAKGIEATVELYAGSMRRAVRNSAEKGEVHLIVTRASVGQRFAGLFGGSNSLLGLFRRPSFFPVLLIHPSTVT